MASLDVSSSQCPGYVVVALRGELDISHATRFALALSAAAAGSQIIVDLAELTFIDCSSLHALVSVREQARQAGSDLLLAAPRQPVARLLSLTGLVDLLPIFASVDEAANGARKLPAAIGLVPEQADGEATPRSGEIHLVQQEASLAGPRDLSRAMCAESGGHHDQQQRPGSVRGR